MRVSSENLTSGVFKDWGVANDSAVTVECDLGTVELSLEPTVENPSIADGVTMTGIGPRCERVAVHIEATALTGEVIRGRGVLDAAPVQMLRLDRPVALISISGVEAMVVS